MQPMHTGDPVARSAYALAQPAANNMPLSEQDTQELRRLLYLKAEGIERQERLQYLRQTWKSSIWSEEDDESYKLPDPEIPLLYSLHYGHQCFPEWDDGSVPAETADWQKKKEHGESNLHAEEDFLQELESLNLDPRLKKLLITYEEVFGALPPPLSCKKLVQMDLKLKPEFEKTRVRRRPYPAPQEQVEEIERQIQECIDAGLVEEYKQGDYPHHCSPCFLVAKPGSTALRLVVDYREVNKKTQNHSGSIPITENTLERIAKCRYKTKMDKRSGFWQVDLAAAAQELLAFITPKDRVFKWKVMPFGAANAPALFQELMNKIFYILRRRPLVQELISRGAEMEAHIDDVSLGTNTKEDHVLLLRQFFIVCQENHLRIKLEKFEFMKEEMEYLGFDVGYGWWKPAASKMQPLQDMQIRDDPKKGLHDVRSFVGACNFYRRHIHNFTYSSAPLTDLIKKTTPWRWTAREEECFQELKKKIASSNCLGAPRRLDLLCGFGVLPPPPPPPTAPHPSKGSATSGLSWLTITGTHGGRPGQRVEEQGTWASCTQKHSKAGHGRPVDRGTWTAKTVKRPRQQPAQPPIRQLLGPLTRKRHIPPHPAQSQHTNYWAPRTRKRHQQEHPHSGRQNAATRRNVRREERVTVQGPVKEKQSDGMSHRGAG